MSDLEIISKKIPYRDLKGEQTVMLIRMEGVLDASTAEELKGFFDDGFRQNIYRFVADLGGVRHMGSAGVGVFIGLLDTLEVHKGVLVFLHPQPRVKETFSLFRLAHFFSITDNVKTAFDELLGEREE